MHLPILALAGFLIGFVTLPTAGADDWPQWRGPQGTGLSTDTNVLLTWSPTNHILWKAELPGRGHSSPAVCGDRIYLTAELEGEVIPGAKAPRHVIEGEDFRHPESMGADRRQTLKVLCLSAADGRLLWQTNVHDGRVYDDRHRKGSFASPTPATDGRHVVTYFGPEGLFCHDRDGKLLWQADLGTVSTLGMGAGTSPLLHEGRVFLQCDQKDGEGSFLQAWDAATGKSLWRKERKVSAGWCSPLIVEASGRTVLLASGMEQITAYDPADGRELWRAAGLTNNAVPSPIVWSNTVLFTAGYPKKRVLAFDQPALAATGDRRPLWQYDRGTAYVPSPVPWDGHFYLMTDSGMLTCLEARTGRALYEGERLPAPAKFTASPVAVAGKILLTAEDGRTFVIRAGPKMEVEAVNSVGEGVFASPAIAGGRLYVRGERHLFCIGS